MFNPFVAFVRLSWISKNEIFARYMRRQKTDDFQIVQSPADVRSTIYDVSGNGTGGPFAIHCRSSSYCTVCNSASAAAQQAMYGMYCTIARKFLPTNYFP